MMTTDQDSAERLVRLNEVMRRVGLGKTMIYQLIQEGRFPPALQSFANRVAVE